MLIYISGIFLLLTTIAISAISFLFLSDSASHPFPIPLFLLLQLFSFVFYAVGIYAVIKSKSFSKKHFLWIIFISIAIRVLMNLCPMIMETDANRYMWDGQVSLHKENPYKYSPEESFDRGVILEVLDNDNAWEIYSGTNHPHIKTIYPPISQLLFLFAQLITPWSFLGWKILIWLAEILIALILFKILSRENINANLLLIYLWSPLVIKEFSNSLHLDVFAVLFCVLVIYSRFKNKTIYSWIFLSLAVSIKWYGLVLLPLFYIDKKNFRDFFGGLFLFSSLSIIYYLPFIGARESLFEGLIIFGQLWQINDGLYSVMQWVVSHLNLNSDLRNFLTRGIVLAMMLGVVFLVMRWYQNKRDFHSWLVGSLVLISSLFFLAPTGNPWYFTWVMPLLVFLPFKPFILFSGLVMIYYFDFHIMEYGYSEWSYHFMRWIEYGIFYGYLLFELLWKRKSKFQLS